MEEFLHDIEVGVELVATLFDVIGVAVIAGGFILGTIALIMGRFKTHVDPMEAFRHRLEGGLLLALEILVAADIIHTVAVELTLENLASLALLVAIRTFLTWELELEMHGTWPWQRAQLEHHVQYHHDDIPDDHTHE